MKKLKVKFGTGTGYVGSDVEEVLEIEINEGTEEEEHKQIVEAFEDWVWEQIDSSSFWNIIDS